jgi:thioredoxin
VEAMTAIKEIDAAAFAGEVLESPIPVLLYFQSEWCPSCKAMSPIVDSLSSQFAEKMKVLKVDTLKSQKIAVDHTVLSTPTLIIFKDGREVKRNTGFITEKNLRALIEGII